MDGLCGYCYLTNSSRIFSACWWRSGGAPYITLAVLPDLSNRNIVGTAVISPKACAVAASVIAQCRSGLSAFTVSRTLSSGDSTAKARMATLSPYFFFRSPSHSSVERHGGHHVAQNSTITTRPAASSAVRGLPARSVSVNLGIEAMEAMLVLVAARSPLGTSFLPARIRL